MTDNTPHRGVGHSRRRQNELFVHYERSESLSQHGEDGSVDRSNEGSANLNIVSEQEG